MSGSPSARLAALLAAAELGLGSDAAGDLLGVGQRMGVDFDNFGSERSSRQLIDDHNRCLRNTVRELGGRGHVLSFSNSWDTKPAEDFPRPAAYGMLAPINCADLQLQTTHRGRVLKGKLVVDAHLMTGTHSVLQDEHGDAVKVAFYNTPELNSARGGASGSSYMQAIALAQRLFPKGQAVAIIEPYYKLMADGTRGVRVDSPAEVVFLDSLEETPEALQQQGDKCLAQHEYKEAVAFYNKSLNHLQQQQQQCQGQRQHGNQPAPSQTSPGQLLLSLLLNLSAAHVQLQHPEQALLYAAGAAALSSHNSSKAYYRAAVALDKLFGAIKGSCSSSCPSSACNPDSIASAATELMEMSVKLAGQTTAAAKAQMMEALVNTAGVVDGRSIKSKQRARGSGSKELEDGEWQVVCHLLAANTSDLSSCFSPTASSSNSRASNHALVASAGGMKEAGNEAFKQGSYAIALHHYLQAFAALQPTLGAMPDLLNSRAVAWHNQPSKHSQQQACLDALTSALLRHQQASAFSTAASALLQLELASGAEAVCQLGLKLLPESAELQKLLQSVQAAAAAATCTHKGAATAAAVAAAATASSSSGSGSSTSSKAGSSSGSSSRTNKRRGKKHTGRSGSGSTGRGDRPAGMTERELKEFTNQGSAEVERVAMLNQLASMAAVMGARQGSGSSSSRGGQGSNRHLAELLLPDQRVPKLHEEFSKAGRWPAQVDRSWAARQLWESYELARALPMHTLGLLKRDMVTPELLLPRLRELSKERVEWLLTAEMGDVRFPDTYRPYGGGWQSFINCPARSEVLTAGTTHVAIGFVDLSSLAASCAIMAAMQPDIGRAAATTAVSGAASQAASTSRNSNSSSSGGGGGGGGAKPLRWVGYEMSAPCVAKTLVLLQMVEQGVAVDEILQVWYSSTWSRGTLASFRAAVTELLTMAVAISQTSLQQRQSLHPSADALAAADVLKLLREWQVKQVPLAAARKGWQDTADRSFTWIANFKRKADRLALCELNMTGELCALGPGDTGSVVMFAVPAAFGERAFDECFLQSLPFQTLMEAWRKAQPTTDIVAVGLELLRKRTRIFISMLRAGLVQAEVHLGAVSLDATELVGSIRALQPYTVSWSNVPDYMSPATFHKLARAISAPSDTVHFMHSMNWVQAVKGAFHLDFTLCMAEEGLSKLIPEMKKEVEMLAGRLYTLMGIQDLLLCPPVDNPRNVVDFGLFSMHHQEYVDAFFAPALSGMRHPARQVQVVEPPNYSILSRTNSTMHITFSYDEDIRFQGISHSL